jgi:hypothetical protein
MNTILLCPKEKDITDEDNGNVLKKNYHGVYGGKYRVLTD